MQNDALFAFLMFVFCVVSIEIIIPSQTARLYRRSSGRLFRPPYLRHSFKKIMQKMPAYTVIGYLCYKVQADLNSWIIPLLILIITVSLLNTYFGVLRPMFRDARLHGRSD